MAMLVENQKPNFILGLVVDKLKRPLSNLIVRAFERDMRTEELLGEAITNKDGKYEITWLHSQLIGRGKKEADIAIKVFSREKKSLLFESDMDSVRFNASEREEINIIIKTEIKPEVVEYDYILKDVNSIANKVAITDLQENEKHRDITFLSKETGMPIEKLEHLVVAHRLKSESNIDADFFYALLRKNTLLKNDFAKSFHARFGIDINTDIKLLLYDAALVDLKTIQGDVNSAVEEMIVSDKVKEEFKKNFDQLQQYKKEADEYYQNEHPRKVLNLISRFALEDKINEIEKLFLENKSDLSGFLEKITDTSFFKNVEKAEETEAFIALGELLGFDETIISQVKESQNIKKPEDVKKLAALNKAGWKKLIVKSADKMDIAGKTLDKKLIDFHASSLVRKMEKEYPTVAFSAQLAREKKCIFKNQDALLKFFDEHDDFDLQNSSIDLLKKNNLTEDNDSSMMEELKSIQRVFKLIPHYNKTIALINQNIRSSQGIASVGETRFLNEIAPKAGIRSKEAKEIFRKAERTTTAAMLIAGRFQDTIHAMDIPAIQNKSLSKKLEVVSKDFPNLKTLFKLSDQCACDHGRSVLSPAAYLVELLQFLDNRSVTDLTAPWPITAHIAKDVLFERRPDLGEIDLGVENAETPMPYIDLVCELLEEKLLEEADVKGAGEFIYVGALSDGVNPNEGRVSIELLSKCKAANIQITENALIYNTEISIPPPAILPSVTKYLRDAKAVCKLTEDGSGRWIVKHLRQTHLTEQELSAAPEYVNTEAYKILADEYNSCKFAFRLPFDLNHTEANAYFSRFNISRSELMRDFQSNGYLTDENIAAEELGLTDKERDLIVTSRPDLIDQQLYWNAPPHWDIPEVQGNVLDYMKRVDHFLDKTGITYKELVLLLSLKFIDPDKKLFIKHNCDDPSADKPTISCDIAKKEIVNLDAPALDRIHRFLRLQKKTGWKFEVLDAIISQAKLGGGSLDDACLIKAGDMAKLSEETGIKLDELIGFYGQIPCEEIDDDAPNPLYHQIFLNKAKNGFIDEKLLSPEQKTGSELLSDVEDSLSVCLQLSKQDFDKIVLVKNIATFGLPSPDPANPYNQNNRNKFTNLSYLYAASRLMKKLKLDAGDFNIMVNLTGIDIQNSPEDTMLFVKKVKTAKQYSLKPVDILFMLRHEATNLYDREMKDDKIKQVLGKLQKDYQSKFSANKSPYDDNFSSNEQKETLQNALSKLSVIGEEDVKIFIRFVDNEWTLTNDAKTFIKDDLSAIFSTAQITSINDSIDNLEAATGPDYSSYKEGLVNLICQMIDPELDISGLSESQRINKLGSLLLGLSGVTSKKIDQFIRYIELGNEKRFIDDRLAEFFKTDSIKSAIDELKIAANNHPQAVADYGVALDAKEMAQDDLNTATTVAETSAAQALLTSAKAKLEIAFTAFNNYENKRKALVEAFLNSISVYNYKLEKNDVLEQIISTNFKADLELVKIVLKYAKLKKSVPGTDLISELLLSDELIDNDISHTAPISPLIDQAVFGKQYKSLRLLHKLFPLISSFKLETVATEWFMKNNHDLDWFEWDDIPYESGQISVDDKKVDYNKYTAFAEMLSLSKQLTPVPNPVDAENPITFQKVGEMLLIEGADRTTEFMEKFKEQFSLLIGYSKEDVIAVDECLFHVGFNADKYLDVKNWKSLMKCLEHIRKLGSTVAQVERFIKPVLTSDETNQLRMSLKARYDEDTWLSTLKEIMDAIRPQKRDALVAYLLAVHPEMNENDLYDYFLVDVEMEACMPSSRIVQAHGSIQLFVQRCLMGLEPKAAADIVKDKSWEQWQWMKNYRVWEANRKVFLYPENYYEEGLRDDKSFLFTELENELSQNEITNFTAEEALINYLEKLDNIAFLEVMATWYQSDIKTMHVFARSKGGDPAIYYYRKFEQERYWTPWEKVELDITGDHLLAYVRNNRLCLAWPVFSEESSPDPKSKLPNQSETGPQSIDKPERKLKIQLAISEFANKKWQPKKISKDAIKIPTDPNTYTTEDIPKENMKFFYNEFIQQIVVFNTIDVGSDPDNRLPTSKEIMLGAFDLTGCKGYPELALTQPAITFDFIPKFRDTSLINQRYQELDSDNTNDLSVKNVHSILANRPFDEILQVTPSKFRVTYPHQITMIDQTLNYLYLMLDTTGKNKTSSIRSKVIIRSLKMIVGTLLPYFMEDNNHAYVIIPGFYGYEKNELKAEEPKITVKRTCSDVLQLIEDIVALIKGFSNYQAEPDPEKLTDLIDGFQKIMTAIKDYRGLKYCEEFKNMYHPLICPLRKTLYKEGIPALMKRETQLQKNDKFDFNVYYVPNEDIVPKTYTIIEKDGSEQLSYPVEDLDFTSDGSYSYANMDWSFHVPFLLATRLTQNQRFEEALTWFHYMFNPTGALDGSTPQRYWVTKPFYLTRDEYYESQRIDNLLYKIADPTSPEIAELEFAIEQWRKKPFKPDVIARFRPVTYQKALLMKYIDNLTEWGDNLFRQDTMESIAQATQMYILADKLLGPKPRIIPPVIKEPYETYNQIKEKLDAFGSALIELENILPDLSVLHEGGAELPPAPVTLSILYFCTPQNDKMLEYWDRIADRLFKIRHCQNIDGIERGLALFAPPIDPKMLVRAAASGLDITSILAGINAPTPYYRFNIMSQKATELSQEVRVLGSSLLQALEKKDAEDMALLRSELEIKVLNAVKDLKLLQIEESKEQIEILKRTKMVTEERHKYYRDIEFMNELENTSLTMNGISAYAFTYGSIMEMTAGAVELFPDVTTGGAGFGGSPVAVTTVISGQKSAASTSFFGKAAILGSQVLDKIAGGISTVANYQRRYDDWKLQERLAKKELDQIDKQITASEIRKEISETDLKSHELQIENAKKTDELMKSKFTNKELYDWMIGQSSSVYFRAYQLAYDFAKKAERSYRFELGNDDLFIQYDNWDSMKKGLQSADHLIHDIKRMEISYLDKNKREYELSKYVSLAMLDPSALVKLKATGVCDFDIPEVVFDMDHPGHYFRRIKSVSVSMPCIAGPYTSVGAKLSLVSNKYRKNANPDNSSTTGYIEDWGNDERFVYNVGAIQSIATSSSQNASGMFELNFQDVRYFHFEGTGAISSWRYELLKEVRQFDYNTISDVILEIKYTAREGGSILRSKAESTLKERLEAVKQQFEDGLNIVINMKSDCPNEWQLFKKNASVDLKFDKFRLPYMAQTLNALIENVIVVANVKNNPYTFSISIDSNTVNLSRISDEWMFCKGESKAIVLDTSFNLSIPPNQLNYLDELMFIVKYSF
ncbi:MAG: hypothetical protein H6Q58_801 [Firmicutes bacterium]|nr:hypothetical protein [Bacillota bacterium]